MEDFKVLQTLYSGLGGHGNVVFSLLQEEAFNTSFSHTLVFYGIENTRELYIQQANSLGIKHYSLKKRPKRYIKSFRTFKKILQQQKPNRILIHSSELIIPAVWYAKKNKHCRVFYVEHQHNTSKTRFEHFLSKFALKKAFKVICLNEAYKNELIAQHGIKNKTTVIPNGIATTTFAPAQIKPTDLVIGMAARINATKDHKRLIHAFKQVLKNHPTAQLKIAGTGNLHEGLQKLVVDLKLTDNIEFVGLLNEEEMCVFYQSLAICVHATKRETLSTAILQAMSCQLPVITSDIENNKVLITNEVTGYLYANEDEEDLAKKMNLAIRNKEQRSKIATAARKHVLENYTSQIMAEHYKKLIQ